MLSGRKFSLIIVVMAVFMAITGGAAFLTAYAFGVRDENQLTAMALISFGAALVGFVVFVIIAFLVRAKTKKAIQEKSGNANLTV